MTPADEKLAQENSSERQRERAQILFICDREECSRSWGELKPVEKKKKRWERERNGRAKGGNEAVKSAKVRKGEALFLSKRSSRELCKHHTGLNTGSHSPLPEDTHTHTILFSLLSHLYRIKRQAEVMLAAFCLPTPVLS